MRSAFRSSIFEMVMLALCIAWAAALSASLLQPAKSSVVERAGAAAAVVS